MNINSKDLHKLVELASKPITPKPLFPILECIKLELSNCELKITGSDSHNTVIVTKKVESKDKLAVCIPAKLIADTLRNLPSQPIEINVDKNFQVTIKSDKGKFRIAGENPIDYLIVKESTEEPNFSIEANVLKNAIAKTSFAAANDDLRPIFTGINLKSDATGFNICGTDTFMLALHKSSSIGNFELNIPKVATSLLLNLEGVVHVIESENKAEFSYTTDGTEVKMILQTLEGKYVPYMAIIPTDSKIKSLVNKSELINTLKRLDPFTNKVNVIKLNFDESSLTISAENVDYNNEASEAIEVVSNGAVDIAFNSKKLLEILSRISGEEITFSLNAANAPCVITGSSDAELFLIMPVFYN